MTKLELTSCMNDAKWEELRLAMYELGRLSPQWRTKDIENNYLSEWDGEWFHHFRAGGYKSIYWLDIRLDSEAQREAVLQELRKIHVPGELTEGGCRVFGYLPPGKAVEYL